MRLSALRILHLLVILISSGAVTYGQSSYQTDTTYVNELLKKGEAIETSKPTAALTYYTSAHKLSKKIGFRRGYFDSVRLLAYTLNNVGRHGEARQLGREVVERAKTDTSNRYKSLGYYIWASTLYYEGRLKEAIPNYQKAAEHLLRSDKPENVSTIYQNLGIIYQQQQLYPQALSYFNRALQIDINYKDYPRQIAIDYYSIGLIYGKQRKRFIKGFYLKSRRWIDPRKDLDFTIALYNNIGYLFSSEAKYDSAQYYQREALRLSRVMKNPRHELHMLMALAQTASSLKNYREAKELLDQSNAIAVRTKAGLYEFSNIYREYVAVNNGLENYKEALIWMDKYIGVRDSLNNDETKSLLQDYEVKIKQAEAGQKLAEKQRQINQLEQERQRQRLWLLIAVLTAAVIGIGLVFSYLYYRQRQRTAERERELAVVQSELQGQQKERLRISKEMHDDLGASLTAIGLLSEVMKSRMGSATSPEVEKISSISTDMVTSMNEIIWSLNTKNDNLNGLIAYIRAYASEFIENTSLILQNQVQESPHDISIRGVDRRNVFLTVKEALNNTVKHAQSTQLTLIIQPEADQLRIEVCDNGRGFTTNGQASLRNGLTNMRNRMTESGGTCEILPSPTGTCVKITFPYVSVLTEEILQT